MNPSPIDRLAKTISRSSRRHALSAALAGAVVATAGTLNQERGDAKKRKKKKCKSNSCSALALGASCDTTLQCCPNETNRICAFALGKPGPICCGVLGAACANFSDCCGGFTCFAGACAFAG